jgi:hypothetical protein
MVSKKIPKTKSDQYHVKVKAGDAEVEIQGAEAGVVRIVEALSDLLRGTKKAASATGTITSAPGSGKTHSLAELTLAQMAGSSSSGSAAQPRSTPVDIRTFIAEKKPSSDMEAAATVAYYYAYVAPENQRGDTIDADTLQNAFRLAGRRLPPRAIWTLSNARNAGYIDSVGDGRFKLNPVGYNLVEFALGRGEKAEKPRRKSKPKNSRT